MIIYVSHAILDLLKIPIPSHKLLHVGVKPKFKHDISKSCEMVVAALIGDEASASAGYHVC